MMTTTAALLGGAALAREWRPPMRVFARA